MKTVLTCFVTQLDGATTPSDNWLEETFEIFDMDKDGYLSSEEVLEVANQYVEALQQETGMPAGKKKVLSQHSLGGRFYLAVLSDDHQ